MIVRPLSYRDPLAAFAVFAEDPVAALLHSALSHTEKDRFSILAAHPFRVLDASYPEVGCHEEDPFLRVEKELANFMAEPLALDLPFKTGALGYFGYELSGHLERLPPPKKDCYALPAMVVGFYDTLVVFDHKKREAFLVSQTDEKADRLQQRLAHAPRTLSPLAWTKTGTWRTELSSQEVIHNIQRIIDYIYAGDIFQANYTQRLVAERPVGLSDFEIYRRLCALSPAPYSAFLRCGAFSVVSASPEEFLHLEANGTLTASPIKGTRRRDRDPERDALLAEELRMSAKDYAENLMIVDLMRSDLGRVCEVGSVEVPRLCALETFASVHHLVSHVRGKKRKNLSAIDVLRATFPGGSITGAPKIRAMEIIHELEPTPRGVYCGCLGWIDSGGAMAMSMVIRTLTLTRDFILAQAGGGIVADSDPVAEYEESMIKMAPLLQTLTGIPQ